MMETEILPVEALPTAEERAAARVARAAAREATRAKLRTQERIDEAEARADAQLSPLPRMIAWIRSWLNRETVNKHVLPAYLILALYGLGAVLALQARNDAQVRATNERIAQNAYVSALSDYRSCITRSATRDDLRGQFIGLYNLIELTVDGAASLVEQARSDLEENYPSLPASSCGQPPVEPN